jgi:Ca2+-binding RTX toxin-like protein
VLTSIEKLEGTAFMDTLYGNDESNYLLGADQADLIYGYDGYDQLRGGSGFDTIYGGDGADDIRGDHNSDSLFGGAGGDTIEGGSFHDQIFGGTGDDYIIAGTGNDTLWGEDGADTFHFADLAFQSDVVMDYEDCVDRLWFAPLAADDIGDFTITGNGTTSVTLLIGANTLVLNGAAPISLTAEDFLFA